MVESSTSDVRRPGRRARREKEDTIQKTITCATVIKDNINWRRHRTACPNYREDWKVEDGLYRCICLLGTPPETREEQELCMKSRHACWRLKSKAASR